jgi:subtilisin-like proprotein convertase family protein
MRTLSRLFAPLLALSFVAFDVTAQNIGAARARDTWSIAAPAASSPREAAATLVGKRSKTLAAGDALELAPPVERDSLAGAHFYFAQTVGGIPVLNGGVSVSIYPDGTASLHDRTAAPRFGFLRVSDAEAALTAIAHARASGATEVEGVELVGWIGDDGALRPYRRVVVRDGLRRHAIMVDAETGGVAWSEPLFATARGRVFDSNPVTATNDATLLDGDDAASAVPSAAYSSVELPGLSGSGPLAGPHASIVDLEIPNTARADQASSLELTRDRDEFEEVNAYFQVDRAQRYLRSLGFTGAREIVPYPIEIDPHAGAGADESSYRYTTAGRGRLFFGDGGVDDAEDADIVLHEFGHAIQDSIVPTGFSGPAAGEARALGEGFCDYWAFASGWSASRASGRDPYCIGDWDARCSPGPSTQCGYESGANCLRRVDGTKTMADYRRSGGSGTEHANGEIWSSALREIFGKSVAARGDDEGRRIVDRTLLESHFGLPPNPTFRTAALRFIDADRRLNKGVLTASICSAMSSRGIVDSAECGLGLAGDLTLVAAPARDVAIPDFDANGIAATLRVSDTRVAEELFVRVNIAHPNRGDLRLTLVAPDGASVVLQVETLDAGDDIVAVYGLDAEPAQPLSALAGKSAAGIWTLKIVDTVGADAGRLVSWGMMFRFAGDVPITTRGTADSYAITIPVTGHLDGAFRTRFVSDVRIANVGTTIARYSLFFTPSGADGATRFSVVRLEAPPGETVALDDVTATLFRESGTGTLEVRGDTANLFVTSRIYNDTPDGTYGQFVRAAVAGSPSTGPDPQPALHILQLSNGTAFRSNLGITEVGGAAGRVSIRLLDTLGNVIGTEVVEIGAWSHVQVPLLGGAGGTVSENFRAEVSVVGGNARVIAYGSVVDNGSGDAIFVPGWTFDWQVLPYNVPFVVPAVIRAPGVNGTSWRSDLRVMNRSTLAGQRVALTFIPASGTGARTVEITIPAGGTAVLDDVLRTLFSIDDGRGSIEITTVGGSDTRSGLAVTSRTWTQGTTGSFGQFIPAGSALEAISVNDPQSSLVHVDSNSRFRCNVGLTEIDGVATTVRVRLVDAAGTEKFSTAMPVPPRGNVQFNLAAAGAPAISNARLTFEVIEGEGRILPYASVIDNATGDPIFVSR